MANFQQDLPNQLYKSVPRLPNYYKYNAINHSVYCKKCLERARTINWKFKKMFNYCHNNVKLDTTDFACLYASEVTVYDNEIPRLIRTIL